MPKEKIIDKLNKRKYQLDFQKKTRANEGRVMPSIRAKLIDIYADTIYRSHIDPEKIFGSDVSICSSKMCGGDATYFSVPFSHMLEGAFLFEMTIKDYHGDPDHYTDLIKNSLEIVPHHPGVGRIDLLQDYVNITRIIYDPLELKNDSQAEKKLAYIKQLQREDSLIELFMINRSHLATNGADENKKKKPIIALHLSHPLYIQEAKERLQEAEKQSEAKIPLQESADPKRETESKSTSPIFKP